MSFPVSHVDLIERDRAEYADLRRWFAYLTAYGAICGSLSGYVKYETELAAADNAPDDVVSRHNWSDMTVGQRGGAILDEHVGHAFIVRNDAGEPERVWSRVRGWGNSIVRRDLETVAARIREHGAPWEPTAAESRAAMAAA